MDLGTVKAACVDSANLAASVERPVLAEGDHVVDALANSLGPHHCGRDATVADDLENQRAHHDGSGAWSRRIDIGHV